jgi:hypothetical protein
MIINQLIKLTNQNNGYLVKEFLIVKNEKIDAIFDFMLRTIQPYLVQKLCFPLEG